MHNPGSTPTRETCTHQYMHDALGAATDDLTRILENTSEVIYHVGVDNILDWVSPNVHRILGWRPDQLTGESVTLIVHPDDVEDVHAARRTVMTGTPASVTIRLRDAHGTYHWTRITGTPHRDDDGQIVGRVGSWTNADSETALRTYLETVSVHDPLTGLMNRATLERAVTRTVAQHARTAIVCVGVDHMSAINGAYTHAAGDIALATIAQRITAIVGRGDLVGRGAGVDFLVIRTGDDVDEAPALAARLLHAVNAPISVGDHDLELTASVGIATTDHAGDPHQLVRAATVAMRTAKESGGARIGFATTAQAADAEQRLTVATDAGRAIRDHRVVAWYQPIVSLATGTIDGYEALARWQHADGTVILPGHFLPQLERTPHVITLDLGILTDSCAALAALPPGTFVSVSVSAHALASDRYTADALAVLRTIDARRIHLEVTETALLADTATAADHMRVLAATGATWYVDDFGTGYSTISHLRDLPITGIKLDVTFSRGIRDGDRTSARLAQGLAGLATGLELDTIAEGIETANEASVLADHGWVRGQGWLYGKAVPLTS